MNNVSLRSPALALDVGAVFDEHCNYVWAALRRLGVRESDLEDLVHEVFLKVHLRSDDYDPGRPIRPWLFAFAHRIAADYRRLARHRVEVMKMHTDVTDPRAPVDQRIEANEERALVRAALKHVDLDRRTVLVMHYLAELPIPEVAAALGIPLNTAYSRLRLARKELAAAAVRLRDVRGGA